MMSYFWKGPFLSSVWLIRWNFYLGPFVKCMVDKVKLLFWKWFLGKTPGSPCFFNEWGIHHTLCWNQYSLLMCRVRSRWAGDWRPSWCFFLPVVDPLLLTFPAVSQSHVLLKNLSSLSYPNKHSFTQQRVNAPKYNFRKSISKLEHSILPRYWSLSIQNWDSIFCHYFLT
jgi:hypothetical protein